MSYIETVDDSAAEGPLKEIYDAVKKRSGAGVPNIYKAQSLAPECLRIHDAYYRELMFGRSPLRRYQREMIATHVSNINECFY